MIGASVDMLLHPSFYGVGAAPSKSRVDEPITQIVYILLGHTHAQPIVALIRQFLIDLRYRSSQLTGFAGVGFENNFLLHA